MKQARYHPCISQSEHATNTTTNTAFRYASCPPCPTQQPYPVEHFVYPQHTTVPSSLPGVRTNALHPHQLNARCVKTSQANLNIRHTLQNSAQPSNATPNPPPKAHVNTGPRVSTSPQLHRGISSSTHNNTHTEQPKLCLIHWPTTPGFLPTSPRVNASTGQAEMHKRSTGDVGDLTTRHSSRSDGDEVWCPVYGGLLGVASSGHHGRIEVDGGGQWMDSIPR